MNQRRNEIADEYKKSLDSRYFRFQGIENNVYCNFHVFAARVRVDRKELTEHLDENSIQWNIYYPLPLHLQQANRHLGYQRGDFPEAEKLCEEVIALPMYPELPNQILRKIIAKINEFTMKQRR